MRDVYLNQIVDITDPHCEFIQEFDKEIKKYGAIVFNEDANSYQFIRKFSHIDIKKEILPDLLKIENTDSLLNGMQITVHYEFDPETETDEENLSIWNEEISQIELPVFQYDEDGEVEVNEFVPFNCKPSKHIIWFLKKESFNYILDADILMITPIIKNINIAKELIQKYGVHPFDFKFDEKDLEYEVPELYGVYDAIEAEMDLEDSLIDGDDCCDDECCCGHHHNGEHECCCGHHEHDCDCCHDEDEHECCCGHHEHDCDCCHDEDEHECCCGHHH